MNSNGADDLTTERVMLEDGTIVENPFASVTQSFMKAFGDALERDIISEMTKGSMLEPLGKCKNTIKFGDKHDDDKDQV